MNFSATFACRDGKKRTIRIFGDGYDETEFYEIPITSLEFGGKFEPFEPICTMTGKVGIFFDSENYEHTPDMFIPAGPASLPMRIEDENGKIEFIGYMSTSERSIELDYERNSMEFEFLSRMEVLQSIRPYYLTPNNPRIDKDAIYTVTEHLTNIFRELYTRGHLYLPSVAGTCTLDSYSVSAHTFTEENNLEPYLRQMSAGEILRMIANQFFLTFVEIGEDVYAFANRPLNEMVGFPLSEDDYETVIKTITPQLINAKEGFTDSTMSLLPAASFIEFKIHNEHESSFDFNKDRFWPLNDKGQRADYYANDLKKINKSIRTDTQATSTANIVEYTKKSNDEMIEFFNIQKKNNTMMECPLHLYKSPVISGFFYEVPAPRDIKTGMHLIMRYDTNAMVSFLSGTLTVSFDLRLASLQESVITVLSGWTDPLSPSSFAGTSLKLRCTLKGVGPDRTEEMVINATNYDKEHKFEFAFTEDVECKTPVFDFYIEGRTDVTTLPPVGFLLSNIRAFIGDDEKFIDNPESLRRQSSPFGEEESFELPFTIFDRIQLGMIKNHIIGQYRPDIMIDQIKEQFRKTKRIYDLEKMNGELDGVLFAKIDNHTNLQFGGIRVDYMDGKTTYTYNEVI